MLTSKKLKIFSLLIFCLFFMSAAWAGSQLNSIIHNPGKTFEPATCTDDSEVYEETEEGNESYDENAPEDMQGDSGTVEETE